jgi:hypothetical protein
LNSNKEESKKEGRERKLAAFLTSKIRSRRRRHADKGDTPAYSEAPEIKGYPQKEECPPYFASEFAGELGLREDEDFARVEAGTLLSFEIETERGVYRWRCEDRADTARLCYWACCSTAV